MAILTFKSQRRQKISDLMTADYGVMVDCQLSWQQPLADQFNFQTVRLNYFFLVFERFILNDSFLVFGRFILNGGHIIRSRRVASMTFLKSVGPKHCFT